MKKNDFIGKRATFAHVDPFEIEQAAADLERSEKMFAQFTSKFRIKPERKKIYLTSAGQSTTSSLYRKFKEMSQQLEWSDKNE